MTNRRTGTGRPRTRRATAALVVLVCLALAGPAAAGAAGAGSKFPSKRPSVPLDVTVTTGGADQLIVSWSPPTYTGEFINRLGVPVAYVITDYDLKGVPAKSWATCPDLALTCTVSGLKPGHTYEIAVRVWNANGKFSPYTTTVAGTPTS